MKKSLKFLTLTMLLAAVMLFTLTGCGSTPYFKYLNTNWDKTVKEVATYDYTFKKGETKLTGTYTTTLCAVTEKNNTFNVGSENFENVTGAGSLYEYKLDINENDDELEGKVYFKSLDNRVFFPVASYTKRTENGVVTETQLKYEQKKVTGYTIVNGKKINATTSINKNSLVFDNVQLQAIARTLNFKQQGQLQFETPIFVDGELVAKKVVLGPVGTSKFNVPEGENMPPKDKTFVFINNGKEFNAVSSILTINEKPAGMPITLTVADGEFKIGDSTFKQPLIKIMEGNEEKGQSIFNLKNMVKVEF